MASLIERVVMTTLVSKIVGIAPDDYEGLKTELTSLGGVGPNVGKIIENAIEQSMESVINVESRFDLVRSIEEEIERVERVLGDRPPEVERALSMLKEAQQADEVLRRKARMKKIIEDNSGKDIQEIEEGDENLEKIVFDLSEKDAEGLDQILRVAKEVLGPPEGEEKEILVGVLGQDRFNQIFGDSAEEAKKTGRLEESLPALIQESIRRFDGPDVEDFVEKMGEKAAEAGLPADFVDRAMEDLRLNEFRSMANDDKIPEGFDGWEDDEECSRCSSSYGCNLASREAFNSLPRKDRMAGFAVVLDGARLNDLYSEKDHLSMEPFPKALAQGAFEALKQLSPEFREEIEKPMGPARSVETATEHLRELAAKIRSEGESSVFIDKMGPVWDLLVSSANVLCELAKAADDPLEDHRHDVVNAMQLALKEVLCR